MATAPKNCKVILPQSIATRLLEEVQQTLQAIGNGKPRLAAFLANDDPAAVKYAEWSQKTCEENGFEFDLRRVGKEDLEEELRVANEDNKVDGIIIYYPIWPDNIAQDNYIKETVALEKDVEGLCFRHLSNMYHNARYLDPPTNLRKSILPCTPLGILKILEHVHIYNPILAEGNRLYGKTITVINRSEVIGRPLAALLANDGANVFSVDVTGTQLYTRGQGIKNHRHQVEDKKDYGLKEVLPVSDVIISGVPVESYKVPTELIRDGAVCINFSAYRNFDGPAVKEKASIYIPSVGKVTVACLLRNLVRLVANRPTDSPSSTEARKEAFTEG
ncbi:Methylenetetrahydrofolate dehydrogenase [NAD(+)] [Gnomoniopsis smithogilvyi]|uniref:Methylenetetrahydrofolate dehydrogenase [NAD(+)] n=1 Tax=Gnomoniopsis smithogilvyi TaxID=1191159 RepID=A0A9W9D1A7_9PEZI|nr:Methylenetetrahydrofolate dehydrogenase [NAD(+)] [Gnomoniopsis smithogilvyi]